MANSVLLEARPYRPFKSSEEYLYAMREDLAEWLNQLYPELNINVDNFMDRLDTGVALCKVSLCYVNTKLYFKMSKNILNGRKLCSSIKYAENDIRCLKCQTISAINFKY